MLTKFCLSLCSMLFLAQMACGKEVSRRVHNGAELMGEVWTESENWTNCQDDSSQDGCNDTAHPKVCMEYSNDCLVPIICKLTVSALLAEPFTGFTKKVTDVRDEVVFYNQSHEVCFNFGKDRYNAWQLIDTSDPIIDCGPWHQN